MFSPKRSYLLPTIAPASGTSFSDSSPFLSDSRLLVILTPGGFEKCIQTIRDRPADKLLR
jgi:hypothetical protein